MALCGWPTGALRGAQPSEHIEISVGRHVRSPGVGDVDGDGFLDLIVPLFNDAAFAIVHGRGGQRFADPVRTFQDPPSGSVQVADLDGDRKEDIRYTSHTSKESFVRSSTPDQTLPFAAQRALLSCCSSAAIAWLR